MASNIIAIFGVDGYGPELPGIPYFWISDELPDGIGDIGVPLVSGSCELVQSLILDELGVDTLSFSVRYEGEPSELLSMPYGCHVNYRAGSDNVGKFFLESVQRTSKYTYDFRCVSAMGLLANRQHLGGVYSGKTVGDVVAEIMDGIDYDIDDDVAETPLYGWLPVASARDNLRQILFSAGASVTRQKTTWRPRIYFVASGAPINIPQSRIGVGCKVSYPKTVTDVELTEHGFYELSTEADRVTLFDNTETGESVSSQVVKFNAPHYSLKASGGLTFQASKSGANYATVSGVGTLTGLPYVHTQKIVSRSTGRDGIKNIASVKDAYLVSAFNSSNVAKRLASYYGVRQEVSCDLVMGAEHPATEVTFTDPFGDAQQGFIKNMDVRMSKLNIAAVNILIDWKPGPFGNSIGNYILLDKAGTWNASTGVIRFSDGTQQTIPTGLSDVRVVLIGGGQGGSGGYAGKAPSGSSRTSKGQQGGNGGEGGQGGRVYSRTIEEPRGTYSFSPGAGGAGGTGASYGGEPGSGAEGSATTFGSYSSADGSVSPTGNVNVISGDLYASAGSSGYAGAAGGDRSESGQSFVLNNNVRWAGGSAGYRSKNASAPGGGGGAAYGSNGGDGGRGATHGDGAFGGKGATATLQETSPGYGCGGVGGNGGGGGGGGGRRGDGENAWDGMCGDGGSGSSGGRGGNGCIILYY